MSNTSQPPSERPTERDPGRIGRRWLWGAVIAGLCVPLAVVGGVGTAFLILGIETNQSGAVFHAILSFSGPEISFLAQLCLLNAAPFLIFGLVARYLITHRLETSRYVRPVVAAGLIALVVSSTFLWAATASSVYQVLGELRSTDQDWPILAVQGSIVANLALGLAASAIGMGLIWVLCLVFGVVNRRPT
ncbi:MAG: hypothetical protein GY791_06485 [Alphaproteobacteria bacterium]|nr:hypothetical protein [Alphaproteobacteria bacterium]